MAKTSKPFWDEPAGGGIRMVSRTGLKPALAPSLAIPPAEGRRTLQERQQAAEEADALSVALAQRERLGAGRDQRKAESALGRFWLAQKLGHHCFLAGAQYGRIVAAYKAAKEFSSDVHQSPSDIVPEVLTEAQRQAQREKDIMAWNGANDLLREIHSRAPGVMERICYDELDPSPYDHGIIINGLVKFSLKWGFLVPFHGDEA